MKGPHNFADICEAIHSAASLIRSARYLTAFTGAGISVESGIPPFRGEGGLWNTYDPNTLGLEYFRANPERAWPILKEIFYEHFKKAKPNRAHEVLARLEIEGWPQEGADGGRARLQVLITQNVYSVQRN
jgi:NAD-dependent deacetylase